MTDRDKIECKLEATRQTYWQAMRETCATIRDRRRRGINIGPHDRLLVRWFLLWRVARRDLQETRRAA